MSVLLFAVIFGIGGVFVKWYEDRRLEEKQASGHAIGTAMAHSIQLQLERSLSSTLALASLIRQKKNIAIDEFDSIAADMIESYGSIDSLQLAPNGVVSLIYPREGNEKALGHDLLAPFDR